MDLKSSTKGLIALVAFLAVFAIIGAIIFLTTSGPGEISQDEFVKKLEAGQIAEIDVNNDRINIMYTDPARPGKYDAFIFGRTEDIQAVKEYNEAKIQAAIKAAQEAKGDEFTEADRIAAINGAVVVQITQNDRNAVSIWSILYPVAGIILIGVFAFFLFRSVNGQNKQAMNFGTTKARTQKDVKVRFNDVAGAEEEKLELQEIVEFLKAPQKFSKVGARIPRGVLLVGPPGTGKTLFAKAVAGEANVPFFSISGSDFVEMFVGVGASRVRDLFDQAKRSMPCIVFIDEIDAVGRQRGAGLGGGNDEREQTLNQLLVQMDGFEPHDDIIVMAATNRADILDPALMRPGRFDRQIYVNIPDVRGREAIFKVHSRNKPMAPEVDFQLLARITSGFSGADIENLLNEAAILCARDNRMQINMQDLYEGINKVVMGPQKKSRLVTEVDKRITAYHEVGHALVAKVSPHCDPVQEVSIIPRGHAAGYTMTRPENDNNHMTFSKLFDDLAMTMGGRAAEEIVIQDVSTGAVGDFKHATDTARKMVTEWGMSEKLGNVYYGSSEEVFLGRDYQSTHTYSEAVAAQIDGEIAKLVDKAYKRALEILKDHRSEMDAMVRLLLERETIYTEEVDMIMDGVPYDKVRDALDERLNKKYASANGSDNTSASDTGSDNPANA